MRPSRPGRLGLLGRPRGGLGGLLLFGLSGGRGALDGARLQVAQPGLRVDPVPLDAEILGRQSEREAEDLRDVQDGERRSSARLHRLLPQVQVGLAQRAGDHDGLGAVGAGVLDDGAAEPHDGGGAAHAVGAAAALDLHVPVDGLGAAGGDHVVHEHRLLDVVAGGDRLRPHEQAAVVGGQLDVAHEVLLDGRRGDALGDRLARVAQQLRHAEDVDGVLEVPAEDVGHAAGEVRVLLQRLVSDEEAVVAGGAGRQDLVEALRLGQREVPRREGDGQVVVDDVAAAGAAAAPVGDLRQGDAERAGDGPQALVVLRRGAVERAPRVVGDGRRLARGLDGLFDDGTHGFTPHLSKIRLTSATPWMRSGRRESLPRVNMPGAFSTSPMKARLRSLKPITSPIS